MFGITVVTAPTAEPLSVDDVKRHLRLDIGEEDGLVRSLITVAREYAELWTGQALMTQTLRLTRDCFPGAAEGCVIRLPRSPVQSLTDIQYTDADGDTATVATSLYVTDFASQPGRIALAYGETWPTDVAEQIGVVKVNYVAGYASAALVPQRIKQAMLLLIGHWYTNREAVGSTSREIDFAVRALLGVSYTGSIVGSYG
jgi:uncharacterized phiE125 gp8 family phage protein